MVLTKGAERISASCAKYGCELGCTCDGALQFDDCFDATPFILVQSSSPLDFSDGRDCGPSPVAASLVSTLSPPHPPPVSLTPPTPFTSLSAGSISASWTGRLTVGSFSLSPLILPPPAFASAGPAMIRPPPVLSDWECGCDDRSWVMLPLLCRLWSSRGRFKGRIGDEMLSGGDLRLKEESC